MANANADAPRGRTATGRTRREMLGALTAGAALGAAPGIARSAERARFGILGERAPAISASSWIDRDGRPTTFDMAEIEGRWVYLKCFQSWCPGCHRHGFPALKEVSDAFAGDERVALVAVQTVFEGFTANTRAKVREIQLQYGLHMKMGHDPGNPEGDHRPATMRRYRTGGTPWVVIIEPRGRVIFNDYHASPDRVVAYLREALDTGG